MQRCFLMISVMTSLVASTWHQNFCFINILESFLMRGSLLLTWKVFLVILKASYWRNLNSASTQASFIKISIMSRWVNTYWLMILCNTSLKSLVSFVVASFSHLFTMINIMMMRSLILKVGWKLILQLFAITEIIHRLTRIIKNFTNLKPKKVMMRKA